MYRVFQHAAGGTILFGLKRYLLATAAGVIVPRVIAVGQHCSSAPRNPFLSQRLKCETTGRSATAPDLDDEGSPRGASHRCTIGRGHNAAKHSFLSAIVYAVLADLPG